MVLTKAKIVLLAMACMFLAGVGSVQAAEDVNAAARKELLQKIEQYVESVKHADDPAYPELVWATSPESTFIHPRGHEFGWETIRDRFYVKTMAGMFSERELKVVGEPVIQIHGDAAVVEFDWEFIATMRKDGSKRNSTGRESQVYVNQPGKGWRIVHVHYSEPVH